MSPDNDDKMRQLLPGEHVNSFSMLEYMLMLEVEEIQCINQ